MVPKMVPKMVDACIGDRRDVGKGRIRVAELFAGVGGFRLGLEGYHDESHPELEVDGAGDFETVWANQWEPPGTASKQFAWRCYESRFGEGSCINADIHAVLDEVESGVRSLPDADMVVGGFPCFVAGTPVLTECGYKPIEDIAQGDMVLTHEGRYRRVVRTGVTEDAPLVRVRVRGSLDVECTPNHPFMVRRRKSVWRDGTPTFEFDALHSCAAADLVPGEDFVMLAKLPGEVSDVDASEEEAWLLGRYMADGRLDERYRSGHKNTRRHRVIYSFAAAKAAAFDEHLDAYQANASIQHRRFAKRTITSTRLCELVHRYVPGRKGSAKTFSSEVLFWPRELAFAFLDGYESGEGCAGVVCADPDGRRLSTMSRDMALMLTLLISRVRGQVAQVHEVAPLSGSRVVDPTPWYAITYKANDCVRGQWVELDGKVFVPVRRVECLSEKATVYNFEVADDHTYVVGQCVVHNCQDYSVSRPLSQSDGIEGKKGVLWWDIHRFLTLKPSVRMCLFENVDRLIKCPAKRRGRDFAIILSSLMGLGYSVEWRVVNSADYGAPQRRRRVFIYAEKDARWDLERRLEDGVMACALPAKVTSDVLSFGISSDLAEISESWPGYKTSPFREAGVASDFHVVTAKVEATYSGERRVLGDVLVDASEVPAEYWLEDGQLPRWEYLKGAKREERVSKGGHRYFYTEGAMAFPDALDKPSRTILTGEGGRGASRFKHVVEQDGLLRRLVPDELDCLQTFPKGWTDTGMSDHQRAFCAGNALVADTVRLIAREIMRRDQGV